MLEYLIFTVFAWVVFPIIVSTDLIEEWIENSVDSILQYFNNKK